MTANPHIDRLREILHWPHGFDDPNEGIGAYSHKYLPEALAALDALAADLDAANEAARLYKEDRDGYDELLGRRMAERDAAIRERDEARQGIQNYIESNAALMRSAKGNRDLRVAAEARVAELETLLRKAHTRLMVSEGNSRYIDNNVALAERIDAALAAAPTDTVPIGRCAHCGGLIRYGEDHVHGAYRPADTEGGAA